MERRSIPNSTVSPSISLPVERHTSLSVAHGMQRSNLIPIYPASQPQIRCFPSNFQNTSAHNGVVLPSDSVHHNVPPVSTIPRDIADLERFSVTPDGQLSPAMPSNPALPPTSIDSFPTTVFATEQPPSDALKPQTQPHAQIAHYGVQIPFFEASAQPLNAETISTMAPLSAAMDSTQPSFYFDSPPIQAPNAYITTRPADLFKPSPRSNNQIKVQQSLAKMPLTSEFGTPPQYHCDRSISWEQLAGNNSTSTRKVCDITPLSALCETAAKENSIIQITGCGQSGNGHLVPNVPMCDSSARSGGDLYKKSDTFAKGKSTKSTEQKKSEIPLQHMPLSDVPMAQICDEDHIAADCHKNDTSPVVSTPRSSHFESSGEASKAESNQDTNDKKGQHNSSARDSPTTVLPNASDVQPIVQQNILVKQNDNTKSQYKQGQQLIPRQSTSLRPFRCEFPGCYKTFDRQYSLTSHSRVHTDSMPYTCKVAGCTQRFKWRSSQAHHMKKKHVGMSILTGRGVNQRYIILGQENLPNPISLAEAKRSNSTKLPSEKVPADRCSAAISADQYSKSSEISPLVASSSKHSIVDQQRRLASLAAAVRRFDEESTNETQ